MLVGTALTAVGMAVACVNFASRFRDDVTASRAVNADHETRLRAAEAMREDVAKIKTDVEWLCRSIGGKEPDLSSPQRVAQPRTARDRKRKARRNETKR